MINRLSKTFYNAGIWPSSKDDEASSESSATTENPQSSSPASSPRSASTNPAVSSLERRLSACEPTEPSRTETAFNMLKKLYDDTDSQTIQLMTGCGSSSVLLGTGIYLDSRVATVSGAGMLLAQLGYGAYLSGMRPTHVADYVMGTTPTEKTD